MIELARLVRLVAGLATLVIAAAIALRWLAANPANSIVRDVHDAGRWLVGPFINLFSIAHARVEMTVNWGLAAVVYLIVGSFIAHRIVVAAPPAAATPAEPTA